MTVMERPPSTLTALTEKELEILRLLVAGHTVKSIAINLNRSEASINERLRDARRKTGVGSSRELARLLDTQKIWDKNIDLNQPGYSPDVAAVHPVQGRAWPKGTIVLLVAMSIAAAAGIGFTVADSISQADPEAPLSSAAARQLPLVGNWLLDVDRIPADERPRRVTIAFRVSPEQQWTARVEIVAADGSTQQAESTAALDGAPVPITGNMPFIDTVSLRQPAPNTLVMTLGKNGAPVSTRVYAVSKDRQSMTETIVWAGSSIPRLETNYFKRIG